MVDDDLGLLELEAVLRADAHAAPAITAFVGVVLDHVHQYGIRKTFKSKLFT
jgi:hypothetical protein